MRSRITLAVLIAVLAVGALVASPLLAGAQTEPTTLSDEAAEEGAETSAEDGTSRQDRAEAFLATFAEELGVSAEEVDAAFDAAVTEQLDTAVADGDLSQEQADRIAERLADRDLAELFGGRGHFGGRGGHGEGRGFGRG